MKSKLIYLGCPYSDNSKVVMTNRYLQATRVAQDLTAAGFIVFSPITHSHRLWLEGTNSNEDGMQVKSWDFWKHLDIPILSICQLMIVYQLPGWKESVGLTAEIEYAGQLGLPILYLPKVWSALVGEMMVEYDGKGELRVRV